MTITKEQWTAVEKELYHHWIDVKFEYKGFELAIQRQRESESKTVLSVYINGTIKPVWGWFDNALNSNNERPEIIKEVWKLTTKAVYKAKNIKEIEKVFGKRRGKKQFPNLHDRHEYWMPYFAKASVLCRQFKKLEGITLIKADCLETVTE
ncbi:MAG: hypothetical protein V5786_10375 [Psychromonas sp.]